MSSRASVVTGCNRCGVVVADQAGHAEYHVVLDDLLEAMERAHRATYQAVIMLFVGVLATLIVAVAAL